MSEFLKLAKPDTFSQFEMYQLFSKSTRPPLLPPADHLAPHAILVFEPTPSGYRQAIAHLLKRNNDEKVYRLVIPYSRYGPDVGDCLAGGNEYVEQQHPPWLVHATVEIPLDEDTRKEEHFPFPSQHRLLDFVCALKHLENKVLLRDAFTGLSALQEFLLGHRQEGEQGACALAQAKFGLLPAQVRSQWHQLFQGNRPAFSFAHLPQIVPWVLASGPVPIHPLKLKRAIEEYIETGKYTRFLLVAECPGHVFDGNGKARCKLDDKGYVIGAPYGVPPVDFHNGHCLEYAPVKDGPEFRFLPCAEECVDAKWDPIFLNARFPDPFAYLDYWLPLAQGRMTALNEKNRDEADLAALTADFIADFVLGNYYELGPRAKRARISEKFRGHELFGRLADVPGELLGTPASMLDNAHAGFASGGGAVFPSGRDCWLHHLHKEIH